MEIVFQSHPDVMIGGNVFRNVPTIIQVDDVPMLEVGRFEPAGFSTRFAVYHSDGTKIAVVSGSQIYVTPEGAKAKITRRCEPNLTICELEGKAILELRRDGATALKSWAELYAPEGVLIKTYDSRAAGLVGGGGDELWVGDNVLRKCVFESLSIGIHITTGRSGSGGTADVG